MPVIEIAKPRKPEKLEIGVGMRAMASQVSSVPTRNALLKPFRALFKIRAFASIQGCGDLIVWHCIVKSTNRFFIRVCSLNPERFSDMHSSRN
jgi:hypothetical protein